MIDAKKLFDRFLGASGSQPMPGQATYRQGQQDAGASPWGQQGTMPSPPGAGTAPGPSSGSSGFLGQARDALNGMGGVGGFAGGAAAGGLVGVLLGGKAKKLGGGLVSHGGAAALGALAHHAYQKWQGGRTADSAPPIATSPATAPLPAPSAALPAPGGEAFELSLIRAMIGAAKVDGHIDSAEQARIFDQVEKAGLDAEAKGFVFDALHRPVGLSEIAATAATPEQAAELYLVSRLVLDTDQAAERAYLQALAYRLNLPDGLVAELERQVSGITVAS